MSATVRALEEDIFMLSEREPDKQTALDKQRLYSRVGQFLMGSFDDHWWCRYPTLMTFMVRILELHPGPDSVRVFYDKMAHQLGLCRKCVDVYHAAMPIVRAELESEFTPTSVKDFFHKISQLDAERLSKVFSSLSRSSSAAAYNATTSTAFYEVLTHRRLWSDFRVIRVISKWLSTTPEPEKETTVDKNLILQRCPGIQQWLVCPDSSIRAWATSLVGRNGIVDLSVETGESREWMKVLEEWMYILESGSFNVSLLNLDLPTAEELPVFLEVTNCVKSPTNQVLWAALDTIMQRMNPNSLEALLESFDNLPDLVFNYLNDVEPAATNPQITFVICKCYGSLMRCLGHRYWNHTVHSPKVVLDLLIQHCSLPSWRVFVTKQLIELLPPLIASMRPPSSNEKNSIKSSMYFEARRRVLMMLLHQDQRPGHFNDQVLCVAASKAVSTIICDCYEPRLMSTPAAAASEPPKSDDGALPEVSLVDLSVVESSFWWPCGASFEDIEPLWINHLFLLLVNPENVVALVDHVAMTCSTVLLKHLSLAREVVYSSITGRDQPRTLSAFAPNKPIVTRLLERLCSWTMVATIPIAVHGALFESVGGIAELMNVVEALPYPLTAVNDFKPVLKKYEDLICSGYLERITEEVLVKGLTNPIRFPVVAQHLTVCLLSPNAEVDQKMKRLLGNAGASKANPDRMPSALESLLIVVHRNAEAYLRGVLSLLQAWRIHKYNLLIVLPTVKKVIFTWMKMFEMLSKDLKKAIDTSSEQSNQQEASNVANLQKVPILIGDFIVSLLSDLYGASRPVVVEESVLIQCLDFGCAFWRFFVKEDKGAASSKRFEGLVTPLAKCMETVGGQAEKRRAAELLMTLVEGFVEGQTRIEDSSISKLETIKGANIESKKSTDFTRMAKKLRQITKTSRFFSPRPVKSRSAAQQVLDLTGEDNDDSPTKDTFLRSFDSVSGGSRPMSGKGAAREQARIAAARSAASTMFEASSKKAHSFYDEEDYRVKIPSSAKSPGSTSETKTNNFNIAQVIQGIQHSHPGARRARDTDQTDSIARVPEKIEEPQDDEDDEDGVNLAPLFLKIKNTQKAIPSSSLLPFFRHLLQVCMPSLLTREFENEKSDRELLPPPLTFKRSSDYSNAYLPLLLEECHNEVQEGLRRCYHSTGKNSGHLMRYESEKPREGMRCLSFSVVEVNSSGSSKPKAGDRFARREKLFHNADVVLLRSVGNRQNAGGINLIGVILISDNEKGRRRQGTQRGPGGAGGNGSSNKDDQELVRVLFLNDGELESVTSEVPSFQMETVAASAIADTEWRVSTLGNLVTASREYIALRSVDMLPEHFRTTILTPNKYESTQTELLKITEVLDGLRGVKSGKDEAERRILKLLRRLDRMDITLTDLRSTSIGKAVNKLRKHESADIKSISNALKDKWTALMDKKDALDVSPRYVVPELWNAIKGQYNQSQLQSIHSVLNNYSAAISLLQGPPGTGKTKTIMGLLSGFLSLRIPPSLQASQPSKVTVSSIPEKNTEAPKAESPTDEVFSNFDLAREVATRQAGGVSATFSLSGTTVSSRILRHTDGDARPKQTAVQALKNAGTVRSRLEGKINGNRPLSADVVRRTLLGPSVIPVRARSAVSKSANVLLCAPSNGAVDELVLRIVTDGLVDGSGKVSAVRAPSVHPDAAPHGISIIRLGHPGEDAPDIVKAVCLPNIIKQELAVHPKTLELKALQDQQRALRSSIREYHDKKNEEKASGEGDKEGNRSGRKGLAKTHSELTQISGRIRRLRDEVSELETKMTAALLSSASIIACTLSKAGSGQFSGLKRGFDALIVDEAAQAVELSTLIPLRERVARAVLVGDPKQLPATVKSVVAANARYDRSLFERIAESGVAPSMLRVQYRMHPFLRDFPSKRFYGGMLADGPSVMERVQRVCGDLYKHPYFQPFLLYDLVDTKESDSNGSKFNVPEAAFCVDLCASLFSICPELHTKNWSVGFVSPYKEQVGVIRKEINRSSKLPLTVSVEVNTVDGFQGREKDVIIFSCVRSSDRGGIGFLRDIRRLNVGITRARFCLFVVGNARTLRRDETWNALVQSAQERKLLIQAKASEGFAAVKRELDRDPRGLKAHYAEMHEKLLTKKAPVASTHVRSDQDNATQAVVPSSIEPQIKQEISIKKEAGIVDVEPRDTLPTKSDGESKASPTPETRVKRELSLPTSDPSDIKKAKTELEYRPRSDSAGEQTASHLKTESSISTSNPESRPPNQRTDRDRSLSRNRDERGLARDHPERPHTTSSHQKRPLVHDRDSYPHKSSKTSREGRRRSRSRSRERPSSASRREDHRRRSRSRERSTVASQRRVELKSEIPRVSTQCESESRAKELAPRSSAAQERERTAEQKHEERQARLRALRDGGNAKVATNMQRDAPSASGRIVQLARAGSTETPRARSTIGGGGGNGRGGGSLLSSILGSTKQLANSTARVDPASARRDHTG